MFYSLLLVSLLALDDVAPPSANRTVDHRLYAATPQGRLSYMESSAGLQHPTLDGGFMEVEWGDMNGDGHPDLISVGDHGSPLVNTQEHGVMVWFGDGRGGWSVFQFGNFGYGGVAVGDVDSDGFLDVGYGIHHNYAADDLGDQFLEVARGNGTGRFWTAWDKGLASKRAKVGMAGTDFADVDNDGDLDIGSNSFGCCDGIRIYLNQGEGNWVQSFGSRGGNSMSAFLFEDLNNDGHADAVVANEKGRVLFGDGHGGFTRMDTGLPDYWVFKAFDVGDVNNDGRYEIALVSSGIQLWTLGDGGQWMRLPVLGLPDSGRFFTVQLADLNADGFLDVAAAASKEIQVYLGDGSGSFADGGRFSRPGGFVEVFRARWDADHNGRPDMVFVTRGDAHSSRGNHLRFFKETSKPAAMQVRIVSPGPNRVLRAGSARFVDWLSAIPTDEKGSTVALELSTTGPTGPWSPIASSLPNNGRYQWSVTRTPSTSVHLRITVLIGDGQSARAVSDQFEIR